MTGSFSITILLKQKQIRAESRSADPLKLWILTTFDNRLLGRILKVGVQNFKQGVQGSNVHVLFNPASPRRSPFLSRETPHRSPIPRSRC